MFNTRKEYIDLLRQLENEVFPKLKKCWGFLPWSIIQIQIGYYFHLIFSGVVDISEKRAPLQSILKEGISLQDCKRFLKSVCRLFFLIYKWNGKWKGSTILSGYNRHSINGYNQYLNPYKEVLMEENKKSEIFFIDEMFCNNSNNHLFHLCIHLRIVVLFYLKIKNSVFKQPIENVKHNAKLVENYFRNNTSLDTGYVYSLVFSTIIDNNFYYTFFCWLLKILKPKIVWLYNYYSNEHSALLRAANNLNIITCEYQHSTFSNEHFAYTKWNNIDLYSECFPKLFYVWGENDKNIILHNFLGRNFVPTVVVSGNYYLNKQKKQFQNQSNTGNILICLQGIWIPEFIENAIKESDGIKWFFRLHPRYPQDKPRLLELHKNFPEKIEMELANQLPLYELFARVSVLITAFSGTAREANELGLKVIIFGEEGYNTYKDYIENKIFNFITNSGDLLDLVGRK